MHFCHFNEFTPEILIGAIQICELRARALHNGALLTSQQCEQPQWLAWKGISGRVTTLPLLKTIRNWPFILCS